MNVSMLSRSVLVSAFWGALSVQPVQAQPGRTTLLAPNLHSLRLAVDGQAEQFPVISLNGGEQLEVSFDDLTHQYCRYTYRLTHCDWEGNPSDELFESEYLYAVQDEEVIDDYEPSLNTSVQYLHYRFSLPNERLKPLLSGNYLLTIYNEDGQPVCQTYFGVVDRKAGLVATCTTNTEIDWNDKHQQVSLELNLGNLPLRDAAEEVKTIVMQNRRYDTAVMGLEPTSQQAGQLRWEHEQKLIFKAGNEYRKMEMLSTRYPGMHGESMRWYDPYYHYTLFADAPRKNYLYDEERNGAWVVAWSGSADPDTEADYVWTHFRLDMLPWAGRKVYVNGRWAVPDFSDAYLMHYNDDEHCYEASILLKTGYYNYQYLCFDAPGQRSALTAPVEGDYFQTENEYEILVYYRPTAARYWQLVACSTPLFRIQ